MNPAFKSKYDQMRESKPMDAEGSSVEETETLGDRYSQPGHIRNLCFIWPDGKRQSLNYSYLVSSDYLPQENKIMLEFTTHMVKLTGVNLLGLYDLILFQVALRIKCIDARYNALESSNEPIVNTIEVTKND